MRYTLRQLEVFRAVAQSESVSEAARSLAMSQSAASGALGDLERQFSVQLFDRVGKRLRLNATGRALRPRVEALLERAADLQRALDDEAPLGPLRVGATLTIGNYLGVHLVARFMRRHPGVEVALDVANTVEIARRVANFELDVGLIEGELRHPALHLAHWRNDELVVFCPPEHPFANRRKLADADLSRVPWVVREPGSGTRQAFERAMHGLLGELDIVLELQHTEAIKHAVKGGLGFGCLSRLALEDEFSRGVLRPCHVPHRDFRRRFYFLTHRDKYRSAGLEHWLALCRESEP